MPQTIKNLGRNLKIFVYLEDAKLGRDFGNIIKWSRKEEYYEGDDEYLGRDDVEPYQVRKLSTGAFTMEEDDAGNIETTLKAIDDAERAGVKPNIKIVELTENNNGTTSKVTLEKITLKAGREAPGKGEKITREFTYKAGKKT